MKPRVLVWSDFVAPTGFANVSKNLLDPIADKYDIEVVGINYHGNVRYDTSKYFVYAGSTPQDPMGFGILTRLTSTPGNEYDIIFLFQDIFNIQLIIERIRQAQPKAQIVIYFPIDGYPFSPLWLKVFEHTNAIITYTLWAKDIILDVNPALARGIFVMYHGYNDKVFYPLAQNKIDDLRRTTFKEMENKFVISNVNRFQPRKNIGATVRAYSKFLKGHVYCKACQHKSVYIAKRCELCGETEKLALVKSNVDPDMVMLNLHMNIQEHTMGPTLTNSLPTIAYNCGILDEDMDAGRIRVCEKDIYTGYYSEEYMNEMYNVTNLNVSTTFGEGAGLSLLEAGGTGTPTIAPNNSAIPEMLAGTGALIRNKSVLIGLQNDNGFIRPAVDEDHMAQLMTTYYNKWVKAGHQSKIPDQAILNVYQKTFLWKDKAELLDQIFDRLLKKRVMATLAPQTIQ